MNHLLCFKEFKSVLMIKKKLILTYIKKIRSVFKNLKNMVFGDKNSNLCLLHKTKSFDLQKYQIYFLELRKMVFDNKKIRSIFYMFKNMEKIF